MLKKYLVGISFLTEKLKYGKLNYVCNACFRNIKLHAIFLS